MNSKKKSSNWKESIIAQKNKIIEITVQKAMNMIPIYRLCKSAEVSRSEYYAYIKNNEKRNE